MVKPENEATLKKLKDFAEKLDDPKEFEKIQQGYEKFLILGRKTRLFIGEMKALRSGASLWLVHDRLSGSFR
jgi:hypothetical protein